MAIETIGLVGGGRIARIMLEAWRRAEAMPDHVLVSDPNQATLDALKARHPEIEICVGDNCPAARQRVVFLGLHPAAFAEAVPVLAGQLRPDAIVVSLAPKVTIEKLTGLLGGFDRIARSIPNAPSFVGAGFNPIAFGPGLSEADRAAVMGLLAPLGNSPVVDEATLEAYAVTAAMGPTYLWFQLYELRELGRSFGLSAEAADEAVEQMARGALETMAHAHLAPAQVMDLVAVHPLAEAEPAFIEAYRTRLTAVMDRIRPA
jgi:pyrroline-5-carboxylate reductase